MHSILARAVLGAIAGGLAPEVVRYVRRRLAARAKARKAVPSSISSGAPAAVPAGQATDSVQLTTAVQPQQQAPSISVPHVYSLAPGLGSIVTAIPAIRQQTSAAQQQQQAPAVGAQQQQQLLAALQAARTSLQAPVPSFVATTAPIFVAGAPPEPLAASQQACHTSD